MLFKKKNAWVLTDDFEIQIAGGSASGIGRGHGVHAGVRSVYGVYGDGRRPVVLVVVHRHVSVGCGQRLAAVFHPRHRRLRVTAVRDLDFPLVPHRDHLGRLGLVHLDPGHVLDAELARGLHRARPVRSDARVRASRRFRALRNGQLGHVVFERRVRLRSVRRTVFEPTFSTGST